MGHFLKMMHNAGQTYFKLKTSFGHLGKFLGQLKKKKYTGSGSCFVIINSCFINKLQIILNAGGKTSVLGLQR